MYSWESVGVDNYALSVLLRIVCTFLTQAENIYNDEDLDTPSSELEQAP